jgi:hypothetical protein
MPIYEVTQDSTGITIEMDGEKPPSQDDVLKAFAAVGRAKNPEAETIGAAPTVFERIKEIAPSFARVATPLAGMPSVQDVQTVTRSVRQALEPEPKPYMLPEASRLDREGMMALLSASPEKREAGKRIGESIGGVVGPKTAAATGVIGQVAADLLSPVNVATLGTLGAARQAARLPVTLGRIGESVLAADVAAAANAAKISRGAELGLAAAFTPQVASGAAQSTAGAVDVFLDKDSTPEDKVRAATEASVSLLMTAALAGGLKSGSSKSASEYVRSLESLADKKAGLEVGIEKGLENLKRARVELGALEATLPKERTTPISDQQLQIEKSIATTKQLVDQALREAQSKIVTGEQTALEKLKAQDVELSVPERIGEGARESVQSNLPEAIVEPVEKPASPLKTTEEIISSRVEPTFEQPVSTPLRSVDDILTEQMSRRKSARMAEDLETRRVSASKIAEQIAEQLESGTGVVDPAVVSRKMIERALGIGREPVGQAAGESLIIREAAEVAKEKALGKYRKKAETTAEKLEGLRTEVEAGLGANPFPQMMGTAWNGAINVAQALIRAGGSVADAIAAGLDYARKNFDGKFDETEFGRQLGSTILKPSAIKTEAGMKPRSFAERAAAAPGVPPVIREAIAASPEASYKPQNVESVVRQVSNLTDAQIEADIANAKSNTRVASAMEKFSRQINSGDQAGATETALAMSKSGTTWGQLINQFKLLKSSTREGVVTLVGKAMAEEKRRPMTPEQAKVLGDAMEIFRKSNDSIDSIQLRLKEAADTGNDNAFKINSGLLDLAKSINDQASVDLNQTIARLNPSSAADLFIALVQGSVMAPISIVRNIVGNTINIPLREASDITAAGIDSALRGGKDNSYSIKSRTVDRVKSFYNSLPQAAKVIVKGSEAMPYEIGSDVGNPLNFTRAWKNLADAMAGQYENAPIARNIVEATIGAIPDITLRFAQATDIPFRSAERARIVSEIGKQKGLSEAQIKVAIKKPELYLVTDEAAANGAKGFTEADLATIEFESARAVYQQDNAATEAIAGINRFIKEKLGPYGYIPYRLVSLFQKTPINVAAEALSFTPAGILRKWSKMSKREQNQAVSKLVIGTVVSGAFSYLYDKGVVSANLDTPGETNKARKLAKSGGILPPGTINVSGLRRLLSGGNPAFKAGDEVKDLNALGVSGALAIMVGSAKRIQERSREDVSDLTAVGMGAALSGINFIMEQQFLKGTSDFIKLLSQEGGNALDRWIKSIAVTAASPLAPNILGSIRRAERETIPAIGGEGFFKDAVNELNQRYAALGLQIPGTKDPNAMPAMRDLWGEKVLQTPKSENPFIYNFLDAWKSREIEADPLNASIYRAWRSTADNDAIPSVPNPKLQFGGKSYDRMTPEQFDRFSELVGKNRRTFAEMVFMSGSYQNGGNDRKIALLKRAYDKGLLVGKAQFMKELRQSGETLPLVSERRGFQETSPE